MDPVHFAMIGIVSLAFGLVTPPYGLCLMIACSVAGMRIRDAIKDTGIMLIPMLHGAGAGHRVAEGVAVPAEPDLAGILALICHPGLGRSPESRDPGATRATSGSRICRCAKFRDDSEEQTREDRHAPEERDLP